jgi:hypothetical protein
MAPVLCSSRIQNDATTSKRSALRPESTMTLSARIPEADNVWPNGQDALSSNRKFLIGANNHGRPMSGSCYE